jgi:transcriptional regulator with XRE-family HTH domain
MTWVSGQLLRAIDLGSRLSELRARLGLKQSEIARRLGVDPSMPSLWEQGKRAVPAPRLAPLAEALGVSLEELVGTPPTDLEDDEPEPAAPEPQPAEAPESRPPGVALDPERLERPRARALLLARLAELGRGELPADAGGASVQALAERIADACGSEADFLHPSLPFLERVFRLVLCRGGGPLELSEVQAALGTQLGPDALRRLGPTAEATYPLTWRVD